MRERIIADFLVIIHLAFIFFVVFGGILVIRWKWVSIIHLPAVAWGVIIELKGWICPLTPLEQHFRLLAGQSGYTGGFIEHYFIALIYPSNMTRPIQVTLGLVVIVINLSIYCFWLYRRKHSND